MERENPAFQFSGQAERREVEKIIDDRSDRSVTRDNEHSRHRLSRLDSIPHEGNQMAVVCDEDAVFPRGEREMCGIVFT